MHTMHTIASFIANVVAGRQPPTRSTDIPPIRPADRFVGPIAVDKPVARSPVLYRDENRRKATVPKLNQAQTPWIHRRVKVVHKTDFEDGSFVFVRRTPDRPTALRNPPSLQHKRRVVEEDDVTEEVRKEFEAWMKARIVAVKHSAGANRVWWC